MLYEAFLLKLFDFDNDDSYYGVYYHVLWLMWLNNENGVLLEIFWYVWRD